MQGCEGFYSDEIMHDSGGVRVVCAVVETVYGARGVFKTLISADHLQPHLSIAFIAVTKSTFKTFALFQSLVSCFTVGNFLLNKHPTTEKEPIRDQCFTVKTTTNTKTMKTLFLVTEMKLK